MVPDRTNPVIERVAVNLSAALARSAARDEKRTSRRKLKFAVAGLAAILLLVSVPAYVTFAGHRLAPLSTAQALDRVAAAATSNPLPLARADQFLYTRSRGTYAWNFAGGYNTTTKKRITQFTALVTTERQAWVSLERPGAIKERRTKLRWVTDRDRRIARGNGGTVARAMRAPSVMGLAPNRRYYFLGKAMTRSELEQAPTDPQTIYRRTLKHLGGAGQGPADGVWQSLTEALYESSYPPAVRAGMVRALGLIPGVRTLGRQRDPLGREGIAFSRIHFGVRDTIIFDESNSAVLFQRSMIERKNRDAMNWPVGTTIADYLAFEQRVVDEIPSKVANKLPHRGGDASRHTNVGTAVN